MTTLFIEKENTTMSTTTQQDSIDYALHCAVIEAVELIRRRLGAADIGRFSFEVEIHGLTQTEANNVRVEYRLSESQYSGHVKGNGLAVVIDECIRRSGWNTKNAPLAITDE